MIKGIGNDILEIDRIKSAIEKNSRFLTKIYTKSELDYYQAKGEKIETLAGMFCAKEAVSKSLGTGFVSFAFTDIEIDGEQKTAINYVHLQLYSKKENNCYEENN